MLRTIRLSFFIFLFTLEALHAQDISSQGANFIVELETVQSPATATFISCSMKRINHLQTSGEQVLIHRSTDNTASWTLVEVLTPGTDSRLIDPVITVDAQGNYYLVLMRIENASLPIAQRMTSLDLYRSTDDGVSWEFVGSAYSDIFPDYPQIISKGDGELFLAFGDFLDLLRVNIKFIKSTDGGSTWSSPVTFNYPDEATTNVGIPDLSWGPDSTILLSFGGYSYKGPCHIRSEDSGLAWSGFLFADQSSTAADNSVLSKIISNPSVDFYGILSHRPHNSSSIISYHYSEGDMLGTTIIGHGAYGEGILTNDSIIHLIYNELADDTFSIKYIASADQGISFTEPVVLYNEPSEIQEFGEYQSLILGNDNYFYLTFCDWADSSKAKTLVFEPMILDYNPISGISDENVELESRYSIYPNPSKGPISITSPNDIHLTEILISSLDGKTIKVIKPDFNQSKFDIDLSALPDGPYIICFKEKERYVIRKFIKAS